MEDLQKSLIQEVTQPAFELLEKRIELIEKKLEEQDKLTANLMRGFVEMNTAIEQLITEVFHGKTEEDKERFRKDLNERYKKHLLMIQEMSNAAGAAGDPEEVIESIRSMAEGRESSPAE